METLISNEDVVEIVRLLGEVAGSQEDLDSRRTQLISGVCELVDADYWVWSLMGVVEPDAPPVSTLFLHGGFSDVGLAQYVKLQEHPDLQWMTAPFVTALPQSTEGQVTRRKAQMARDEDLQSAAIYPLLMESDLDAVLLSGRKTSEGQISVISLFRGWGRPQFDARETRLAHIILSEVRWLHDTAWPHYPREGVTALPRRERSVLGLLLQGQSRKDIADRMELSIHTINDYVKDIYAAFDVHSHAELIHRFYRGNQGDEAQGGSGKAIVFQ